MTCAEFRGLMGAARPVTKAETAAAWWHFLACAACRAWNDVNLPPEPTPEQYAVSVACLLEALDDPENQ